MSLALGGAGQRVPLPWSLRSGQDRLFYTDLSGVAAPQGLPAVGLSSGAVYSAAPLNSAWESWAGKRVVRQAHEDSQPC